MVVAQAFDRLTAPAAKKEFLAVVAKALLEGPELADAALTASVTKAATADADSEVRYAALETLVVIVEKQPELADAALTASVTKAATTDADSAVRSAAQETLGVIVGKRPDLADAALTVTILAAAMTDADSEVRGVAQSTLGVIVGERPDLAALRPNECPTRLTQSLRKLPGMSL
jgi:hypothetical protein